METGNLAGYTENVTPRENKSTPLPIGVYTFEIIEAEVRNSSSGNPCCYCTYVVDAPEQYKNRRVWDTFSLHTDIGKARLFELAIACGHPNPKVLRDTNELLNKTMSAKVKIESKEGFEPRNKISVYLEPGAKPKAQEPKAPETKKKPW